MPKLRIQPNSLLDSFVVFLLLVALAPAASATTADDLCDAAADPCEVSTRIVLDPDSVLDFSPREFRMIAGGALVWTDNLTINAGRCARERKTAIKESKTSSAAGFLTLNCGDISIGGKISTVGAVF